MKTLLVMFIVGITICNYAVAAERKFLKDVVIDEITNDTQASAKGSGDVHVALAWWVPNEFWISVLSRDTTTSTADKKSMLNAMSDVSLLGVVQADISPLGAFNFYTKQEVENNLQITFTDSSGVKRRLLPKQSLNPDLEIVLSIFKPILGAAMGKLGTNFHFYVLNDKSNASGRLMDPYHQGVLDVQLSKRNDVLITATIEMPLNSLFIPRKCPNGKDAHVSWKYCPWSGRRLEN